jgi:hypothetical protein
MRALFTGALALVAGACVGVGSQMHSESVAEPPVSVAARDEAEPAPARGGTPEPEAASAAPAPHTAEVSREEPFFVSEPDGRPTYIRREKYAPNVHYAALDRPACEAELARRSIAFERAPEVWNVMAPVWLKGPLHGVTIRSKYLVPGGRHARMEIMGCRLVLALDDFSALLAEHDITEVLHLSAFRSRKEGGCTPKYNGKQHCAGLALDVASLRRRDGTVIDVQRDFHGRVGLATCVEGAAPVKPGAGAELLWGLVCDAARKGIFHVMLTPNYNAQHHNHLHLEITPDAGWMLVK